MREPGFFCKIADNMQTPLQEFKAIIEEDDEGDITHHNTTTIIFNSMPDRSI
jgi:hypothetical protein